MWYWFIFPYHIEKPDIYIYLESAFSYINNNNNNKEKHPQRRSRPQQPVHLQHARLSLAALQWLAETSVSAAPKTVCLS